MPFDLVTTELAKRLPSSEQAVVLSPLKTRTEMLKAIANRENAKVIVRYLAAGLATIKYVNPALKSSDVPAIQGLEVVSNVVLAGVVVLHMWDVSAAALSGLIKSKDPRVIKILAAAGLSVLGYAVVGYQNVLGPSWLAWPEAILGAAPDFITHIPPYIFFYTIPKLKKVVDHTVLLPFTVLWMILLLAYRKFFQSDEDRYEELLTEQTAKNHRALIESLLPSVEVLIDGFEQRYCHGSREIAPQICQLPDYIQRNLAPPKKTHQFLSGLDAFTREVLFGAVPAVLMAFAVTGFAGGAYIQVERLCARGMGSLSAKVLAGAITAPSIFALDLLLMWFGRMLGGDIYRTMKDFFQGKHIMPPVSRLYPYRFTAIMALGLFFAPFAGGPPSYLAKQALKDPMWDSVRSFVVYCATIGVPIFGFLNWRGLFTGDFIQHALKQNSKEKDFIALQSLEALEGVRAAIAGATAQDCENDIIHNLNENPKLLKQFGITSARLEELANHGAALKKKLEGRFGSLFYSGGVRAIAARADNSNQALLA